MKVYEIMIGDDSGKSKGIGYFASLEKAKAFLANKHPNNRVLNYVIAGPYSLYIVEGISYNIIEHEVTQ